MAAEEKELATTKGKAYALDQLHQRCERNKGRTKKDNGALVAGSPMYYYCVRCNDEFSLHESHSCKVPALCKECRALKDCGWLE